MVAYIDEYQHKTRVGGSLQLWRHRLMVVASLKVFLQRGHTIH